MFKLHDQDLTYMIYIRTMPMLAVGRSFFVLCCAYIFDYALPFSRSSQFNIHVYKFIYMHPLILEMQIHIGMAKDVFVLNKDKYPKLLFYQSYSIVKNGKIFSQI